MTTDDNPTYDDPAAGQPGSTTGTGPAPDGQATDAPPWRAMIAVSQLAAHPGNVRADLDLNEEFVTSIAVNGVLVALRITPDGDGFRIIDGGRRLAAALKAGVGEVPYDLVAERAGDEAGQYLDMITANRHRNPLTVLEEADALFAARKAGAAKTRLRKATGMSPAAVNDALAAARLDASTRAKTGGLGEQLTLDQYAMLAEFHDDPDAVDRLLAVAGWGGSLEHEAERIRQQRAERSRPRAAVRRAGRGRVRGRRLQPGTAPAADRPDPRRRGPHPGDPRQLPRPGRDLPSLGPDQPGALLRRPRHLRAHRPLRRHRQCRRTGTAGCP